MPLTQTEEYRDTTHTGILGDLDSRLWVGHNYWDSDPVTSAHEMTHGVNANIRNKKGSAWNAGYFLFKRTFLCKEPKTTLKEIAAKIDPSLRDRTYNLYMVQQASHWNRRPLYIADEASAYHNGTLYGIHDESTTQTRLNHSFKNGTKFVYYMSVMVNMLGTTDKEVLDYFVYIRARYKSLAVEPRLASADKTFLEKTYDNFEGL